MHTGLMRVVLKTVLDCDPDAAWRAIRSPAVFTGVSSPFTTFTTLEPNGFPELWTAGEHPVRVRAFGLVPLGDQIIDLSFEDLGAQLRLMYDTGHGLNGALTVVTRWEHTMAIAPASGGKTLYRDRLIFEAGSVTIFLWPLYWAFWQWRAIKLRQAAASWRR